MNTTFAAPSTSSALIDSWPRGLALAATIGSGLAAGVFFSFSTFVMSGLRRLPANEGISAMQAINKDAPASAAFMTLLFGTAAIGVASGVLAIRNLDDPGSWYRLLGAAAYLVVIVLTIAYHVPHNDALAQVDPNSPGAAHAWATYARDWTAWNHGRTLGGAATSVLFALSLRTR